MEKLISHSSVYPKELVIEARMIDVNEDIQEVTNQLEDGTTYTEYQYTTYRFRNIADYANWLNERKNAEINALKTENSQLKSEVELHDGCIMELSQIVGDLVSTTSSNTTE